MPDGNIEFLGREDFQVKIRGHRIELGEIESALLQHDRVQAVVAAAAGETRGNKRLVAYVVPAPDEAPAPNGGLPDADSGHAAGTGSLPPTKRLVDPLARLRFKLQMPGLRKDAGGRSIQLGPDRTSELLPEYLRRWSSRRYSRRSLSAQSFAELLGVLTPIALDGSPFPKYRYASAGSLYPVQTYVYVKPDRITDVAPGAYYYDPISHRLASTSDGARLSKSDFPHSAAIFEESAFALFQVGELDAVRPMYGDDSRDFCLIEAGLICQLLETAAPDSQIGLCQIGGLDFRPIRSRFGLSDSHAYLHCLLGGPLDADHDGRRELMEYVDEIRPMLDLVAATPGTGDRDGPSSDGLGRSSGRLADARRGDLADVLKTFLGEKLPEYMVPASFVFLESLPLSSNGKVDRRALPEPELVEAEIGSPSASPRTSTEQRLTEIWREVLGIDQFGIDDNFFELGGDSVRAIQIIARANRADLQITPIDIFDHQTVAELAAVADAASARTAGDPVAVEPAAADPVASSPSDEDDFDWSTDDLNSITDTLKKKFGEGGT